MPQTPSASVHAGTRVSKNGGEVRAHCKLVAHTCICCDEADASPCAGTVNVESTAEEYFIALSQCWLPASQQKKGEVLEEVP